MKYKALTLFLFLMFGCNTEKDKPCLDNEYASVSADSPSQIECMALTVCQDNQYESVEPTYSSDRVCANLSDCTPGQHISVPATATTDRVCQPCTLFETYSETENAEECIEVSSCLEHEYIAIPATLEADLSCGDCQNEITIDHGECLACSNVDSCNEISCDTGFYVKNGECRTERFPENADCSLDADGIICSCSDSFFGALTWDDNTDEWLGECTPWTDCAPGSFVLEAGTKWTDRICDSCTIGIDYSTTTNAVECTLLSDCPPGEYVLSSSDGSSDRLCEACTPGLNFSTTDNAPECTNLNNCLPGEYVLTPPTSTTDRICDTCTEGVDFSITENAAECSPVLDCPPGSFVQSVPTVASDRVCQNCSLGQNHSTTSNAAECTTLTDCTPGEHISSPATLTSDRSCTPCNINVDFSSTSNAMECTPLTDCPPGDFVLNAPTTATDRTCESCTPGLDFSNSLNAANCTLLTDCSPGESVLAPPTLTNDRICTPCDQDVNYSNTVNSNMCTPVSDCEAGQFILSPPTLDTDRICQDCTPDQDFSSTQNATECTPLSDCTPGEYVENPPTTSSDRACSPCTLDSNYSVVENAAECTPVSDCVPGEYILSQASLNSDRSCDSCTTDLSYSTIPNADSCDPVHPCESNEYEVSPPTLTSDRTCETLEVSVEIIDNEAHEGGLDTATIRIHLSAIQSIDTEIDFTAAGSAEHGLDYHLTNNGFDVLSPVVIPAGLGSVDIDIEPVATPTLEVTETLDFHLEASTKYELDSSSSAEIFIMEYGPSNGNVYFVDEHGDDNNIGSETSPFATVGHAVTQLTAGDTLYIKDGTYTNDGYSDDHGPDGDTDISNPLLARVNASGTDDNWITIAAHPDGNEIRPLLKFDGLGGIQINSGSNYIRIEGLEIQGPNKSISFDWAHEHRWSKENFYTGRGIYTWGPVHHIVVQNCNVHHTPGSGIRFNKADYVLVEQNIVSNTTWWSSSAESAIVIATAESIDTEDVVKFLYSGNIVYNNWNFLEFCSTPFANSTDDVYGNCDHYTGGIIDGQGLYVTRNNNTYLYGRMRFENNIAYNNGFGGVVYHKTDRGELVNNLVFQNGAYPGTSNYTGMTVNTANDLSIINNLIWARDSNDYGLKNNGNASNITTTNNYVVGVSQFGTEQDNTFIDFTQADDLDDVFHDVEDISFANPDPHATSGDYAPANIDTLVQSYGLNFQLLEMSTGLIDNGTQTLAPTVDIEGVARPQGNAVDIGPYELEN